MKIPSKYYQFKDEPSIILVTANQEAYVYKVADGEVGKIGAIEAEKPEERDRPGVFVTRRKGMVHHGESLEEKQQKVKDKAIKNFLNKLKKELDDVLVTEGEEIPPIYLFTPDLMEGEIRKKVPKEVKEKIKTVFWGIYIREHPLDLVKKIDKVKQEKKVIPTDEEAIKILKRKKE
ncbi:MAG: hypothetical protein ACLFNN_02290 [Candidatus Paceibacterota bacterium]